MLLSVQLVHTRLLASVISNMTNPCLILNFYVAFKTVKRTAYYIG
jgi:hypothetical protein